MAGAVGAIAAIVKLRPHNQKAANRRRPQIADEILAVGGDFCFGGASFARQIPSQQSALDLVILDGSEKSSGWEDLLSGGTCPRNRST